MLSQSFSAMSSSGSIFPFLLTQAQGFHQEVDHQHFRPGKKFRSSDGRICHPSLLQTFSSDVGTGQAGVLRWPPAAQLHPIAGCSSPLPGCPLSSSAQAGFVSILWRNGLFSLHRSLNLYWFQAIGSPHCAGFVINSCQRMCIGLAPHPVYSAASFERMFLPLLLLRGPHRQ